MPNILDQTLRCNTRSLTIHTPMSRDRYIWDGESAPTDIAALFSSFLARGWLAAFDSGGSVHLIHATYTTCEGQA